ncbi:MAG: hypothetical protein JXB26_10765 [Candidatus Aminicenantes bacterium]|nr:hypothetical protein [Candidatus Aminicenantes bacterium]
MKKTKNLSLCAALIFGILTSTAAFASVLGKPGTIQEQEEEKSEIKQLTIKNSGFRSRSTVIIRYQDKDKKIVEVIENGRSLPPSEFSRYESVMRKVLELPQINQLLPEIDKAYRRAVSLDLSEEYPLDHLRDIMKELEMMDSDIARRYRHFTAFQLQDIINRLTEKIADSTDLSQEEKIERIKKLMKQSQEMMLAKKLGERRERLIEFGMENAARRLIEVINKSEEKSQQEKIIEIREVLQQMRETINKGEKEGARDMVEFEAANVMRKMIEDIVRQKELTAQQKSKQIDQILKEATAMKLEQNLMVQVEKFKFDLHQLLKEKGLLPEGKAEFVLKLREATIDGKKLPKKIHEQILKLCQETMEKKFSSDTKIVLGLNENR